jgi:hypothetical protein
MSNVYLKKNWSQKPLVLVVALLVSACSLTRASETPSFDAGCLWYESFSFTCDEKALEQEQIKTCSDILYKYISVETLEAHNINEMYFEERCLNNVSPKGIPTPQ